MRFERNLETAKKKIGQSEAVDHFLSKYGNARTKWIYAYWLHKYVEWLGSRGIDLNPDRLVDDNLVSIFKSDPTDVRTKRKHTDWLNSYVNEFLVKDGMSEATRRLVSACVKEFYRRNDSELFGDFAVSSQRAEPSDKPLKAEDIRTVLKALPINVRAPLLFEWQSGIEQNRVLSFKWKDLKWKDGAEAPFRIDLYGRKTHQKSYCTFVGRETVSHLKTLGMKSEFVFPGKVGATSELVWLNGWLKKTAAALMKEKLIDDYPPSSWRSHMLRHSFETEAAHAGVSVEIRNFFLGHVSGIEWTYNHRDQIHAEDLIKEYSRIEPFVSLEPNEASIRSEYELRENALRQNLEQRLASLEKQMSERLSERMKFRP